MLSIVDTGPPPPCPAPYSLVADVLAAGREAPDKIALAVLALSGAERWSYARLTAAVLGTARGLAEAGLAPGDRVLLRLANSVDFPVAFLGAAAAGLVPVPTPAGLSRHETSEIARRLDPAAVIAAPGIARPDHPAPVIDTTALRAMRDLPGVEPTMGDPDRPAFIVFTSGTSGAPEAVVHAHRAIRARRMMWADWTGLNPDDRVLHAGAFNWTYTLGTGLLDPWAAGATALVPAEGVGIEALPLLLGRHDATVFAAVPGVFRRLLRAGPPPLPRLRHALSAGEKLPQEVRHRWQAATGTDIHEAFGMSECSTFVSGGPSRPAPPGTLGYAQTGRRIAVLGPDGAPVTRGQTGTLAVAKGDPGLMLGYAGAPDATAARERGEWFLTGDAVHMAGDGAIHYHGRTDDLMTAGGFRVSPLEVEAALGAYPGIADCAAADVAIAPDTRVIAAFYVAAEDLDPAALSAHMSGCLAAFKVPRLFVRLADLPRSANGKLKRRAIAQSFEART